METFADEIFDDPFFSRECEFTMLSGTVRTLTCIVQPAGNDDLQILPEGDRYNPVVRLMTQEPVENKVRFSWNGHRWRIISTSLWNNYGYYDTLATRYEGSQTDDSGGFAVT